MRGFAIFELLMVMGLLGFLLVFSVPIGLGYYRTVVLDEAAEGLLSSVRRARRQAMVQKNDSAFGVRFFTDRYVLFQGSSYVGRNPTFDEIIFLPTGITKSGVNSIVFLEIDGTANSGTLTLAYAGESRLVTINSQGVVW